MAEQTSKVIRKDIINLTCEFCKISEAHFSFNEHRTHSGDLVETWLHQILYKYDIYPKQIFKLKKSFEVPVHIAIHPSVQSYISQFVQSCHPLLEKREIKFISLTVKEAETDIALEKFAFEVSSMLKGVDLPLEVILESESIYALADLTQHLRSCLIKLNGYQSQHTLSNSRKTFSLSIEKLQGGYPSTDSNKEEEELVDWIPADQQTQQWKRIIVLKTVPMDLFQFNTFVMEAASRKGKERC